MTTATQRRRYAARLPAAQRREQLLDAALSTALEEGFHAVTVDGVARRAGVTRPVVYGAFEDRTALLLAVVERAEQRALEQLAPAFPDVPGPDDDVDPDALLLAGVEAFLRAVTGDPSTWRVILLPPEGAPSELRSRLDRHRSTLLGRLEQLCAWGLRRRGGPADLDARLFALAVFTLAQQGARLLLVAGTPWTIDDLLGFTRTTLSALRT